MRNIRSLIKDENAMCGSIAFIGVGTIASTVGLFESCRVIAATILYPVISSTIGSFSGSLCTWMANILTA